MAREQKRNIAELKTEEQEQSVVYGILLIYFEEKFFIKDVGNQEQDPPRYYHIAILPYT